MARFNVTYEIVTPESAEHGEADESGFVAEAVDLREAVRLAFETRACHVDGVSAIEADEWPIVAPRWVTVGNGVEWETGAHESRSLHIPAGVSPASRRRIARLMGCS